MAKLITSHQKKSFHSKLRVHVFMFCSVLFCSVDSPAGLNTSMMAGCVTCGCAHYWWVSYLKDCKELAETETCSVTLSCCIARWISQMGYVCRPRLSSCEPHLHLLHFPAVWKLSNVVRYLKINIQLAKYQKLVQIEPPKANFSNLQISSQISQEIITISASNY